MFQAAALLWDGQGMLVMTSTGSIYSENQGGTVTEYSPVDNKEVTSRIIEGITVLCRSFRGLLLCRSSLRHDWFVCPRMTEHYNSLI